MIPPGFTRTKRSGRWAWALLAFGSGAALVAEASGGCTPDPTPDTSDAGAEAGQGTIGSYCDQLLPTFCRYAIDTCGADGPLARCKDNARPICCQGACSRPAKLAKDIEACKLAYAGREAGVDEAGNAVQAQAGLPCAQVLAGLTPEACQDVVELQSVATPPAGGLRPSGGR